MTSKNTKKFAELSVFLPAYNEAASIELAVQSADKVLRDLVKKYEIIVVDDGSQDTTSQIVSQLVNQNKRVRLVRHKSNQGYGAAVWSGIKAARYDWVFFTDADLQFKFEEIGRLLKYSNKYDTVIGYRQKRNDPLPRLLYAKSWNFLNRVLFGLKVKDINCAFKLFRTSTVAKMPVQSRGAMVSAEILIRLAKNGVDFKEVAVTHQPREHGSATGAKLLVIKQAFTELFRLYDVLGKRLYSSMIKFMLVGVVNTLVDWATYFALTRSTSYFASHVVFAKSISFICGTVPSFIGNKYWTFRQPEPIRLQEVSRFYVSVSTALVINVAVVYVLVEHFQVYDLLAVVLATIASFVWSFCLARFWVFKPVENL